MNTCERVLAGDIRAISRLISGIESGQDGAFSSLAELLPHINRAHVIGFTGAPGAGKSSLIGELLTPLLDRGSKVAVLAVDPSSQFTGGALLGDRIRMQTQSDRLYIRSLASRGRLGGLSAACLGAIRVLDAAGYDKIILETVGTGQSEIEVRHYADTIVVVLTPNQGDDIQAMKAGILEIGDVFCVNKAELSRAEQTASDILHTTLMMKRADADAYIPPVVKTSVLKKTGTEELISAIDRHFEYLCANGAISRRRARGCRHDLESELLKRWRSEVLQSPEVSSRLSELSEAVAAGKAAPWLAADQLWNDLKNTGKT